MVMLPDTRAQMNPWLPTITRQYAPVGSFGPAAPTPYLPWLAPIKAQLGIGEGPSPASRWIQSIANPLLPYSAQTLVGTQPRIGAFKTPYGNWDPRSIWNVVSGAPQNPFPWYAALDAIQRYSDPFWYISPMFASIPKGVRW